MKKEKIVSMALLATLAFGQIAPAYVIADSVDQAVQIQDKDEKVQEREEREKELGQMTMIELEGEIEKVEAYLEDWRNKEDYESMEDYKRLEEEKTLIIYLLENRSERPNVWPYVETKPERPEVWPGVEAEKPERPNVRPEVEVKPERPEVWPGVEAEKPERPNVRPEVEVKPERPEVWPGVEAEKPERPNVRPEVEVKPERPEVWPGVEAKPERPNVRPEVEVKPERPEVWPGVEAKPERPEVWPGVEIKPERPEEKPEKPSQPETKPEEKPGENSRPEGSGNGESTGETGTPTDPGQGQEKPQAEKHHHKPFIEGYADGTVRPENDVVREEVATMVYRVLDKKGSGKNIYKDLKHGRWSEVYIGELSDEGILNGYEDGSFKPQAEMKRGEFAKMIAKAMKLEERDGDSFNDIEGHWAEGYIHAIEDQNWVDGYEDGSFKPDDNISRAEMIKILDKVVHREVKKDNCIKTKNKFKDLRDDKWYFEYVLEACTDHDYLVNGEDEVWVEDEI